MSYDLLASFYDAFIDHEIYQEYINLIDKYTSKGTLLDIGCGTGTLSLELSQKGFQVMATDLSEEMLQIVNFRANEEHIPIKIAVYDMLDPFSSTYDTVIASMDVINHLADLEDVLFGFTNIYEGLNENGVFIFDVLSAEYIDALDGYVEDDQEFQFHWESHKGNKEHSIVHTITLNLQGENQEVRIYEETHDISLYESISLRVGFKILEKKVFPERTIFVLQKTE
ncbi:MAG: class I SAM-dependent methyltransferase [Firmicutes bacterium]|nr:class I SAM-dependent methyltransferase [Bacillota bacterium]